MFTLLTIGVKNFFANVFLPFLVLLSVLFFLWGVVTAITTHVGDQYDEGKRMMSYGLIGVIVFAILWGLFYFSLAPELVPTNPALLKN